MAIRSSRCPDTQALYGGSHSKRFRNIESLAERKLQMLDAAVELRDLRAPAGKRLESHSGDRAEQHSIRVNDEWRVYFIWTSNMARRSSERLYPWLWLRNLNVLRHLFTLQQRATTRLRPEIHCGCNAHICLHYAHPESPSSIMKPSMNCKFQLAIHAWFQNNACHG